MKRANDIKREDDLLEQVKRITEVQNTAFTLALEMGEAKNKPRIQELEEANAELLEALKYVEGLIKTARRYFPKSIKNSDKFQLENTCATIGKAIHKAEATK